MFGFFLSMVGEERERERQRQRKGEDVVCEFNEDSREDRPLFRDELQWE